MSGKISPLGANHLSLGGDEGTRERLRGKKGGGGRREGRSVPWESVGTAKQGQSSLSPGPPSSAPPAQHPPILSLKNFLFPHLTPYIFSTYLKLANRTVPQPFQSNPLTLLYISPFPPFCTFSPPCEKDGIQHPFPPCEVLFLSEPLPMHIHPTPLPSSPPCE